MTAPSSTVVFKLTMNPSTAGLRRRTGISFGTLGSAVAFRVLVPLIAISRLVAVATDRGCVSHTGNRIIWSKRLQQQIDESRVQRHPTGSVHTVVFDFGPVVNRRRLFLVEVGVGCVGIHALFTGSLERYTASPSRVGRCVGFFGDVKWCRARAAVSGGDRPGSFRKRLSGKVFSAV